MNSMYEVILGSLQQRVILYMDSGHTFTGRVVQINQEVDSSGVHTVLVIVLATDDGNLFVDASLIVATKILL